MSFFKNIFGSENQNNDKAKMSWNNLTDLDSWMKYYTQMINQ
jgi:hypothetical protein